MNIEKRVQARIEEKTLQNRFMALFMAFAIILLYVVNCQLIIPGVSMSVKGVVPVETTMVGDIENVNISNAANADDNVVNGITYSPKQMSLATLLFGEGSGSVIGNNWTGTVDDALNKAMDVYFLGLASEFCAFIEEDFTAKEADAEGRVFVGGNIKFDNNNKKWNYQVGSGDFASLTPLTQTDDYSGIYNRSDFAHLICGGSIQRINTISTGNRDQQTNKADAENWHYNGNTVVYDPDDDMYKKLFIKNVDDSKYYDGVSEDIPYSADVRVEMPGSDNDCNHTYLEHVNQLAQFYVDNSNYIETIKNEMFSLIRARSLSLGALKGKDGEVTGNTVVFNGDGLNGETYYFYLKSWNNINRIEFKNIPDYASIIVNVGGQTFSIKDSYDYTVDTFINGVKISNIGGDDKVAANDTNNNVNSKRILYNFYEATGECHVESNFNGTILAPNADVKSDAKVWYDGNGNKHEDCAGHLSGALIAKSFSGFLEFGYRPYRGSAEILGTTSGYVVPVDKIDSNTKYHLSGAQFGLYDSTDKIISAWMSDGETEYVPIPLQVDFSGKTQYPTAPVPAQKPKNTEPADEETEENETDEIEIIEQTTESTTSVETTLTETTAAVTETETVTAEIEETTDIAEDEEQIEALSDVTEENEAAEDELIIENEELLEVVYPNLLNVNENEAKTPLKTESASYKIKEISAPTGYIKTDDIINIEVSEKIYKVTSYNNNNGEISYFPDDVDVEITVKKNTNDEVLFSSVLNIKDSRDTNSSVIRDITIDDKIFRIKDSNKNEVYLVNDETETPLSVERQIITTTDGKKYYFDNRIMMVIPLPENNITIENKPGLTFKKVDDSGNELKGATISFSGSNNTNWYWDNETSSCLIDISSLKNGENYTFTENSAPSGYEIASAISFEKTGDYKIKIDGNEYSLPHTVEMVDQKIYGVKNLTIFKYDGNDGGTAIPANALNGAKFNLHAKDGTIIEKNLESGPDGKITLDFCNSNYANNAYVKSGYLIPGVYYLSETKVPDVVDGKPFTLPDDIYFTVKSVQNGGYTIEKYKPELKSLKSKNVEEWETRLFIDNENDELDIKDVVSIEISGNFEQCWSNEGGSENLENYYKEEFGFPVNITELKIYKNGNGQSFSSAIIQTVDGDVYAFQPSEELIAKFNDETDENSLLSISTDQTLQIANKTQEKINISVEKKWEGDEDFKGFTRPESVTVQLYRSTDENDIGKTYNGNTRYNEAQVDLENNWKYTWNDLDAYQVDGSNYSPYYYYVEEPSVDGYTTSYSYEGNNITITNTLDTISVTAQKEWDNRDLSVSIPSSVTVKLQYQDGSTWKDTGKRLTLTGTGTIWTGTFEGLPSGKTYRIVEVKVPGGWKLDSTKTKITNIDNGTVSITNIPDVADLTLNKQWDGNDSGSVDKVKVKLYRVAEKNEDVVGGYHDAGDHVMFGLPQGFTASTLGWSYYEFRESFGILGQKGHFDIIFKRFADFFYNSVKTDENGNVSKLLVRKGIPGEEGVTGDHDYWGAPELQYSRAEEMTWATSAPDIASEYAATLAQYSIFYDDENADKYLETAKKLYEFAKNESGRYNGDSDYYNSETYRDDRAWAAGWLYKATREPKYKDSMKKSEFRNNEKWDNYSWNCVGLGASVLYAEEHQNETDAWSDVTTWLNSMCNNKETYFYYGKWGSTRNNCGAQLVALVAAKHGQGNNNGTNTYSEWAKSQMGFILGEKAVNSSIQARSYVIGFGEDYPKHEHHRAASGTDSMHTSDESAHLLIGGMVGGPTNGIIGDKESGAAPGHYNDDRWDYEGNEVALDYNAVLVGAAAGLYDCYKAGKTDSSIFAAEKSDPLSNGLEKVYGINCGTNVVQNDYENYAKLLQYSLYFYDANMCGRDVDENSAFVWRKNCHTDDGIVQIKPTAPTPQSAPRVTKNVAQLLVDAVIPTAVNESQTEGQTIVKPSSRQRTIIRAADVTKAFGVMMMSVNVDENTITLDRDDFKKDINIPSSLNGKKIISFEIEFDSSNIKGSFIYKYTGQYWNPDVYNDFDFMNGSVKQLLVIVPEEHTGLISFQIRNDDGNASSCTIRINTEDEGTPKFNLTEKPNTSTTFKKGDTFIVKTANENGDVTWKIKDIDNLDGKFTCSKNADNEYTFTVLDTPSTDQTYTIQAVNGEITKEFTVKVEPYVLKFNSDTYTVTQGGRVDIQPTNSNNNITYVIKQGDDIKTELFTVNGNTITAKTDTPTDEYTVIATADDGRKGTFTLNVTQRQKMSINGSDSFTVEQGEKVNVSLNNAHGTVTWKIKGTDSLTGFSNDLTVNNDTSVGTYTLIGTDSSGDTVEITVTVNQKTNNEMYLEYDADKIANLKKGDVFTVIIHNAKGGTGVDMDYGMFDRNDSGTSYTFTVKGDVTTTTQKTLKFIDYGNNSNTISLDVTIKAPPQTIKSTPSTDYVESNGDFTYTIESGKEFVNPSWTVDGSSLSDKGFVLEEGKITVNGATAGVYTFTGVSETSNTQTSFKVEVLERNQILLVVDNINKIGYATFAAEDGYYVDTENYENLKNFNVKRIAVKFDKLWNNDGANFGFAINGSEINKDNYDNNVPKDGSKYSSRVSRENLVYCVDVNDTFESVNIKHWWDDNNNTINISKVYYIYEIGDNFTLSADKTEVLTGETVTITAAGNIEGLAWENVQNAEIKAGSESGTFEFNAESTGDYTLKATNSVGVEQTVGINVIDFRLQSDSIRVKAGETAKIQVDTNTRGEFEFKVNGQDVDEDIFKITSNGNMISVNGFTATDSPITVTATKNGYSKTFTVQVTNGMRIVEKDKNPSESSHDIFLDGVLQLETQFAPDSTVEWSVDSGIAEIDQTGKLTAKKFGTVTVTAKSGDETASYIVNIKSIPSNAVEVETYTIPKGEDDKWECVVKNLPRTDSDGNEYIYYLVEETSNGYIPIEYSDGTKLSVNDPSLSVTNKLSKSLPETGSFGTTKIKIVGVSIMILAAFELSYTHKRRRRKWSGA